MASNPDGFWSGTEAAMQFQVDPLYWQTTWFRLIVVLTCAVAIAALYRMRLHQLTRQLNVRFDERMAERTRIARDLHDTLLQGFQGLMLRLQVVDDLLAQEGRTGRAKQELELALERADQAIAEGRDAVHDLRASAITTNDLARAVSVLGNELAADGTTAFRLVAEGPARDLHPIVRDEIYRIACEALRNAFSHARAGQIEAEIAYSERLFRIRIRDDGRGIGAAILEEGRPGHYGLPGMRERATEIGAKLSIWSGDGTGTEIELSIAGSIAYTRSTGRPRLQLFGKKAG
jgi:signal transduction histidine kinase